MIESNTFIPEEGDKVFYIADTYVKVGTIRDMYLHGSREAFTCDNIRGSAEDLYWSRRLNAWVFITPELLENKASQLKGAL